MTGEPAPLGRVAVVHDALVNTGGAERVVLWMLEALPGADLFTSVYLPEKTYPEFRAARPKTFSWLSRISGERQMKLAWPLVVGGFRLLSLQGYETVLCSSTFAAKAIRPPRSTRYALYCYAPFRLLWAPESYAPTGGRVGLRALRWAMAPVRAWDKRITRRADRTATTCRNMAERLAACYGVSAAVVPAPIDWHSYQGPANDGDYYLAVSRLNQYKRIDLAVDACTRLGRPLVVAGDGPLRCQLERRAGPSVRFLGRVSDVDLRRLYRECRALLFPSEEDYGLVPLEVQASGRPVIAFGRGGALETVMPDVTGLFFEHQTVGDLVAAIERFESMQFGRATIREHARGFDVDAFKHRLRRFVAGDDAISGRGV